MPERSTMSNYIYFTEEQKASASNTDIAQMLLSQGEKVTLKGKEYVWGEGSNEVKIKGNKWYSFYMLKGGDAIDFVKHFCNLSYPEAIMYLLNGKYDCTIQQIKPTPKERKPLLLPLKHDNLRRIFAYLVNERGIDREVLHEFVHAKMIYECATFHNVVFVGYDKNGVPRHAHRRSIGGESRHRYTVAGSDAEFSFHWNGTNDTLYLFEAPIDMLSFITMNQEDWKNNSYAASCSVSDRVLFRCLKDNPNISKVYLCFDSDEAGQRSAKAIEDKLFTTRGIESEILIPKNKDWNDDLLSLRKGEHEWKV